MKPFPFAARFLALTILVLAVEAVAQPPEVVPGVYRVDQILGAQPYDDLAPLAGIVGDAELVGLGEGVHTSGGFYRAKLRMIQYLIEVEGFRAFGIESPWIDAESATTFVRTCGGSAVEAARGLFGVWQSETLRDLLDWMCRFNRQHPDDPLVFFGFDSQQSFQDAARLRAFLERIGVARDHPLSARVARCIGTDVRFPPRPVTVTDADHQACLANLAALEQRFDSDQAAIVAQTSRRQLARARMNVIGLRATEGQLYHEARQNGRLSTESRDRGMALLIDAQRALVAPGARTVLWAHNAHIAKADYSGATRWMGSFLDQRHGPAYRSVAIVAEESVIDWPSIGCGPTQAPGMVSIERRLAALGEPFLLVNLARAGALIGPLQVMELDRFTFMTPAANFDGVFFLDVSPAMRPTAWTACGAQAVGAGTDPVPGCALAVGRGNFCDVCGPCVVGEGDCDRDADCAPGLLCLDDRGADVGVGAGVDLCLPAAGGPPAGCLDTVGSGSYCPACGPCADGQGDCDNDAECGPGLVCVSNVGAQHGFAPGVDVCRPSAGGGPGGPPPGGCQEPLGSGRYCTACGPCGDGEGDCDSDAECAPGLVCTLDVGAQHGFAPGVDVCTANGAGGCAETLGSGRYCSVCGPCGAGEGDCDNDAECAPGLVCVADVGAQFGFAAGVDVCQ